MMENSKEEQLPGRTTKSISSSKSIQYIACLIVTLNLFSSGMHHGWSSPSLPKLLASDSKIKMTNEDGSWLAITVLFGSVMGSFVSGGLLTVLGRRKTILLTSLPLFISWMMIAFADTFIVLVIARFFAGVAEGMSFCSAPTYIGEIADKSIRGFLATVLTVGSLIGVFAINIMGSYLTIQVTALISSIVPLFTFVTFLWMPESPYFLLITNKYEEAKRSLRVLKGTEDVDLELCNIQQFITTEKPSIKKYWKLFKAQANRKALLIVLGIRAVQQCCGATAITFYAQTIFDETRDAISPIVSSSIYFGCLALSTMLSCVLVDRVGRKPLLLASTLGVAISLLIECLYFYSHPKTYTGSTDFSIVSVMALVLFVSFFGVGLQTIPIVVESELFETYIKAVAVCISDMTFSLTAAIMAKLFQFIKDELELYVIFLIFSICSGIGLIFIIFVVPETKGKTLETIQVELTEMKDKSVSANKFNDQS